MKRRCTKCKKEKELNEENFYKRLVNTGGYTPACKECMVENGRRIAKRKSEAKEWSKLFIQ